MRAIPSPFSLATALLAALGCMATPVLAEEEKAQAPEKIERRLIKEPAYASTPKYSLITLGSDAPLHVWMVEDGRQLFVDKNANGDLTDDGPPLMPAGVRDLGKDRWDFSYLLDAITPADGSQHTKFQLRHWCYGDGQRSYGLSLTVAGRMPMYAGWFGSFWSDKYETAPVIRFGGPFTPRLLRGDEFQIGSGEQRLSVGFMRKGSVKGSESRLSIEALPPDCVPVMHIEWPVAAGSAPLRTTHALNERCCYWEYYTSKFQPPAGIIPGKARLTLEIPAPPDFLTLTTTDLQVPVTPAKQATNKS